jgi:hypothetical protein
MDKYRIIETKIPVLSRNMQGTIDFIPEIEYITQYHVEVLATQFCGLLKDWVEVRFATGYEIDRHKFKSIEEAQRHIDFRETQIETNVAWKN